ncbi:uncharacterized protein LOC117180050 [Belonocnema kinseyi]|uniref:uncharacterized protein LOC117180050 n=1 Tax=Belonocnema kinseyi TaxID=2817044 RepID=UPI00143DE31B|nr:uncharacterized protein LOC117180050 [Belonocnema kinseyi]
MGSVSTLYPDDSVYPQIGRRLKVYGLESSMQKIRKRITIDIDRLNVSLKKNKEPTHKQHGTTALSKDSKAAQCNETIEKIEKMILFSGGLQINKIRPSIPEMKRIQRKNIFTERDTGLISLTLSSSLLTFFTALEDYLQPMEPMGNRSEVVLFYYDGFKTLILEKSIVSCSLSNIYMYGNVYDDVDMYDKVNFCPAKSENLVMSQKECSLPRVLEVPEGISDKFGIDDTLQNLHCSLTISDEFLELRSSSAMFVDPVSSKEELENAENDHILERRKWPCANIEEEEVEGFVLAEKINLEQEEADGFVLVTNEKNTEKTNSFYASIYNTLKKRFMW